MEGTHEIPRGPPRTGIVVVYRMGVVGVGKGGLYGQRERERIGRACKVMHGLNLFWFTVKMPIGENR